MDISTKYLRKCKKIAGRSKAVAALSLDILYLSRELADFTGSYQRYTKLYLKILAASKFLRWE